MTIHKGNVNSKTINSEPEQGWIDRQGVQEWSAPTTFQMPTLPYSVIGSTTDFDSVS